MRDFLIVRAFASPIFLGVICFIGCFVPLYFWPRHPGFYELTFSSPTTDSMTFVTYLPDSQDISIQRYQLSISSWLLCDPHSIVIILLPPNSNPTTPVVTFLTSEFGSSRVVVSQNFTVDNFSVPFVPSLISTGILFARSNYFCFINPNIVVDKAWYSQAVEMSRLRKEKNPHLIGQRLDVEIPKDQLLQHKIVTDSFFQDIQELFKNGVSCIERENSDYFVWVAENPPMFAGDIPPFKIGGGIWDRWIDTNADLQQRVITFRTFVPVYYIGEKNWEVPEISLWNEKTANKSRMRTFTPHSKWYGHNRGLANNIAGMIITNPPVCNGSQPVV